MTAVSGVGVGSENVLASASPCAMLQTAVELWTEGSEVMLEVVLHACDPNTWEVEAGQSL